MGKNYRFEFNDLEDFYTECEIPDEKHPESATKRLKDHLEEDSAGFRGKSLKDIHDIKYGYVEGVDLLDEIDQVFPGYGASKFTFKWDDLDGDDMSMERAYEGMPFLKQRRRMVGNNSGKFVTIDVVISENAFVDFREILNKTLTAVSIANRLESLGYRIAVNCISYSYGVGYLRETKVDYLTISVPVKRFEDPVNLPLMITAISPWFFRYWIFAFKMAKFKCTYGLGQSRILEKEDTRECIVINNGECLTKQSSMHKIKKIAKLFDLVDKELE